MKKSNNNWREEFEELVMNMIKTKPSGMETSEIIKSFISTQIKSAQIEGIEMVKLEENTDLSNFKECNQSRNCQFGYNQALADLETLKKKLIKDIEL